MRDRVTSPTTHRRGGAQETTMDAKIARKLLALPDFGEMVIDGEVWTRFADFEEFKVSPHGKSGDYDRDAYYVSDDELNA
jgi:hypothetical protein